MTCARFMKVYAPFYYFIIIVKAKEGVSSYLGKLCLSALSLMKAKAEHRMDDFSYDESHDDNTMDNKTVQHPNLASLILKRTIQ